MYFIFKVLLQKSFKIKLKLVDIARPITKEISQCTTKYQHLLSILSNFIVFMSYYINRYKYLEIYVNIRGKYYSLITRNRFVICN